MPRRKIVTQTIPNLPPPKETTTTETSSTVSLENSPADPLALSDEQRAALGKAQETARATPVETDRPEKRKYTKRRKSATETSGVDEDLLETADAFGMVAIMMMEFVSKRMPVNIPPTETEIMAMNKATSKVALKYLKMKAEMAPEFLLAGCAAAFVIPRLIPEKKATTVDLNRPDKPVLIESPQGA